MATSATIVAPAKVNLGLLVGPRRSDGYHEIATLMVPITLADTVTVELTPGGGLNVDCPIAAGETNLAARAVRELEARLDRRIEARVTIEKRVPAGAGLGGGSSDAAATLRALERLLNLKDAGRMLFEAALAVGSDVPFFLSPGAQFAGGRGQVLRPVDLPALHLVVAVPDLVLATADVYRWYDDEAAEGRDLRAFASRRAIYSQRVRTLRGPAAAAALTHNDLEGCVVARHPQVAEVIAELTAAGARAAALTGSGAAVYGLFAGAAAAEQARAALAPTRAWCVTDLQPLSSDTVAGSNAGA